MDAGGIYKNNLGILGGQNAKLTAAGGLSVDIQSATAGANQRVQGRLRLQGAES